MGDGVDFAGGKKWSFNMVPGGGMIRDEYEECYCHILHIPRSLHQCKVSDQ
jgi:hypothetical protein